LKSALLGITTAFGLTYGPRTQFFFKDNVPYGEDGEIICGLAKHCANVISMRRIGFEKRTVWGIFLSPRSPKNLIGTETLKAAAKY
jgi:hypothetical protein